MIYYVDIDKTVFAIEDNAGYESAKPIKERIEKINKLFDEGHTVIYWTARGSGEGRTVEEKEYLTNLTFNQLNEYGCKRHQLKMGKPVFDFFIDDKAFNSEEFFNEDN